MHRHAVVFNRERAEQFNEWAQEHLPLVIPELRLRAGDAVADIGSGGGAFSVEMAQRTLPDGRVVAVDSFSEMLDFVRQYAASRGAQNVETLLLPESGLGMPEGEWDLVFMRQVYHHLDDPPSYLTLVRRALKPMGQLVIIDFIPGSGHGPEGHSVPVDQIISAAKQAGFTLLSQSDVLGDLGRSFLTFGVE